MSQVPKCQDRAWVNEVPPLPPLIGEDWVRDHLRDLNVPESMQLDKVLSKVQRNWRT